MKGLTDLQTDVLFVLWKHWQEKRDSRDIGLTVDGIKSQVNKLRRADDPEVLYQRVAAALETLVQRGEEDGVGWPTIFIPRKEETGGRPSSLFRLVATGNVSWGETALLLRQLNIWTKKFGDFDRRVLARPFYDHLRESCKLFETDQETDTAIDYCVRHDYLLTDPPNKPFVCLFLGDRTFCEQELIHRIAESYIKHVGLTNLLK